MNQELLDMARQAHHKLVSEVYVGHAGQLDPWTMELLEIFAALVAAAEREKVEDLLKEYDLVNSAFAKDFRARGETK